MRMPDAPVRGSGITYRKAEQAEPHGGGGQGLLAFAAVLIAGMLFIGGALAIFLSAPRATATPTRVASGESPDSTLPVFVQPTPTPSPVPSPSPPPSFLLSPTPGLSPGLSPSLPPSFLPTPTMSLVPTPTPTGTPTQTPTTPPTPEPTPSNCSLATGTPLKYVVLNSKQTTRTIPDNKVWCLDGVRIEPGQNYGNVRLTVGNRVLFEANCVPGSCAPTYDHVWTPEEVVIRAGRTLVEFFTCADDPLTLINECTDPNAPAGAVITIGVEVFPAP